MTQLMVYILLRLGCHVALQLFFFPWGEQLGIEEFDIIDLMNDIRLAGRHSNKSDNAAKKQLSTLLLTTNLSVTLLRCLNCGLSTFRHERHAAPKLPFYLLNCCSS
jgi:hypothetical protein